MSDKQVTTGKLSRKTIDRIFNSLKVALATKCEELLYDDFGISGRAIETSILIIQPMQDEFEFPPCGIGRIADLHSRLRLIIDDETLTGQYVVMKEGKVHKLVFKTKKTTVEFKCKDPDQIKTRKVFNDKITMTFNLNADAIRFMTNGSVAMKNKSVMFRLKDGSMFIRLIDSEGDVLDHLVTDNVTTTDDLDDDSASFSYEMPKLAPILNAHRENTTVNISKRGIMNITSDGFNIYLVPDHVS
jgi:hypothetical protein